MEKQKEQEKRRAQSSVFGTVSAVLWGLRVRSSLIWALLLLILLAFFLFARTPVNNKSTLEQRLCAALSQLEGAGEVEVVIYQSTNASNAQGVMSVFSITGGAAQDTAPSGVLVLAQGADDMRVRLDIARAVQSLLGVPASSVEVLKKAENGPS